MALASLWKGTFAWVALMALLAVAAVTLVPWPTRRDPPPPTTAPEAAAPSDPVADYLSFADRLDDAPETTSDDVIVEGLRRLAGAIGAAAVGGGDVAVDLRVAAEHVVLNPASVSTTELIRDSLRAAGAALEADRGDAGGVRQSAEALDPAQPITAQRDRVIQCFRRAAAALRRRA